MGVAILPRWAQLVKEALRTIDRPALVNEIADVIDEEHNLRSTVANFRQTVSATLQTYASESPSFEPKNPDLFKRLFPARYQIGLWQLRETEYFSPMLDIDIPKTVEGGRALAIHIVRERSGSIVRAFKANLIDLSCKACGFNFAEKYGELGRDYIEAHHQVPLGLSDNERITSTDDFIALCSNCHRMVHRLPDVSVETLKTYINDD